MDVRSLRIVTYPDPVLRRKAAPVDRVTPELRELAERMLDLMYDSEGIGLAAPQVGVSLRLFVAHVPENDGRRTDDGSATDGPEVYINPVLSGPEGGVEGYEEGCLSLPEVRGEVLRPPRISIRATDLEGREFTRTGSGLVARCWQHEIDHLDGVLIIDKMTQLSRLKNRSAIRDLERARDGR